MVRLRGWVFSGLLVFNTIAGSLWSVALWLLPHPIRYFFAVRCWAVANLWLLRVICGLDWEVRGLRHLPKEPGVVLMKHSSAFDIIVQAALFPRQAWLLKRELLWVPLFGWALAAIGCVGVDRARGARAVRGVVRDGKARIEQGLWVMVFPEGTRMAPGETGNYAPGGAMIASAARCPVVPVAHNAGDYWPRRSASKKPGTISIVIGPPLDSRSQNARELTQKAKTWIESEVIKLREVNTI
ncbi:MAG: lysophospholipid acyltransferase family protein [Gammaproteobacteria bacterium]|nr:lysophospholipid acyltransferase family protein [Gammaproteobacteria bacterium]MCY4165993.1 lysophospholipid acyltransferase family protein [Gammaproteobacteria bacterium]MCY4256369.1 lysophospholipid acyltransferase family protein [Gammaproteobacteria bacterium]MCY4341222.1 lysophospholipid acyltransferase family protein [Gammaproteobacteria bacterium]